MHWFTSDLHLGHTRLVELGWRDFPSIDHMNQTLLDNWRACVDETDVIHILGDVVMGTRSETLPLLADLPGYKVLVLGNHDTPHLSNWELDIDGRPIKLEKYQAACDLYDSVFDLVVYEAAKHEKRTLRMSHFPYDKDERHEGRYQAWQPEDYGDWLLHGHVHELWKVNKRQINVGVDVWNYAPVSIEQINELIEERLEVDALLRPT